MNCMYVKCISTELLFEKIKLADMIPKYLKLGRISCNPVSSTLMEDLKIFANVSYENDVCSIYSLIEI